jgi:hypothetical protein
MFTPPGPADDRVAPDRIGERRDDDVGAVRARRLHRHVDVADQIAGALVAERIRDRRLEAEHRDRADRRQHELRHRLARRRRDLEHALLRFLAAESRDEAVGEAVEVFRRHAHMGRVVLRAYGDGRQARRGGRRRDVVEVGFVGMGGRADQQRGEHGRRRGGRAQHAAQIQ